ncbi:unnamed protein product [Cuscuta campestris]|uniref:Uncharacterized protein n=1 Tax=Cuscuta campestris TaxID=132261 RepID=A0A484M9I3_9ASTE|nr:unnamed protein product [Cuscuta campestris]
MKFSLGRKFLMDDDDDDDDLVPLGTGRPGDTPLTGLCWEGILGFKWKFTFFAGVAERALTSTATTLSSLRRFVGADELSA